MGVGDKDGPWTLELVGDKAEDVVMISELIRLSFSAALNLQTLLNQFFILATPLGILGLPVSLMTSLCDF